MAHLLKSARSSAVAALVATPLVLLSLLPVAAHAEGLTEPAAATESTVPVSAAEPAAVSPSTPAPQPATPSPMPPTPPPMQAPGSWGFSGSFGYGGAGGDFGNLFRNPLGWEYAFFKQMGAWRAGIGLTFGGFKMKNLPPDHPDLASEPEWGYQEIYLFGQRTFNAKGTIRPYLQARGGIARLRPRSEIFKINPLPPEWESGQHIMEKTDGFSVALVPGIEWKLNRAAFLDTSLSYTYFSVDPYDLSPIGQPSYGSGTAWEARVGITWFPNGEQQGPGVDAGPRDAWGVKRSYGWAAGEVLAINNLSGVAAQYVRDVDWSETNPRSWWDNLKYGLAYDPDNFKTNQWTHPFNGSQYYNSARTNGVSFWPSAGFALGGAFEWEMAGETQRMSLNDMFATTLGGIALGEAQYRLSSEILNNQSRGMGRFWRELGGFFVDPMRGFNRIVRGEATRVADNPVDPMDWRPQGASTFVATGVRSIGEGSSITNNTKSYATILLNHSYGDVFDTTRRKPFDYLDFVGELNFGEKTGLSNVQIRGNLASWPLGGGAHPNHVFAFIQHFDYMNNTAYEFGGQSLGAALSSRFRLSDKLALKTRVDADAILMGGINSEYSYLADVPNPERLREYDFGPGLGTTARADLTLSGRPLLMALYRFAWISVTNGSVYTKGTAGLDANHYIQGGGLRLVIPVKGGFGVGADAYLFLRDSDFQVVDSATGQEVTQHVRQRNPQVRIYLAMSSTR